MKVQQVLERRHIRKKVGMVDHKARLGRPVEPHCLQDEVLTEAVVEKTRARAEYGLGGFSASRSWRPREAESRGHVGPILKMVLHLVPQTRAEGQAGTCLAIILDVDPSFRSRQRALGRAARNRKLGSASTPRADCRGAKSQALEQQSAAVTFEGRNRCKERRPAAIQHDLIPTVELRRKASGKGERSAEIPIGTVRPRCGPYTRAELHQMGPRR